MDTDIAAMLNDQLERLLGKAVSRQLLIDVEERGLPAMPLWQEIESMGVPLALVGEGQGGAALSWAQTEPLLRTIGRHAAPVPLAETMVAAGLMSAAGLSVPAGAISMVGSVFALAQDGSVSGGDDSVAWVTQTPHVLLAARRGAETFLALLSTEGLPRQPQRSYARIPSAALAVERAQPLQIMRSADTGELGLLPHLAVLRSVLIAGLLERILALCVEYANTRVQFGKPIGKFQAIQHQLAELAGHVAAAQVAALYACRRIAADDVERAAAVAKIRSGLSATRAAAIAHQVMGAIGFTDEHILHYYTRRLWQWRCEAGSDHFWSERLGRALIAAGGEALWPSIVNAAQPYTPNGGPPK